MSIVTQCVYVHFCFLYNVLLFIYLYIYIFFPFLYVCHGYTIVSVLTRDFKKKLNRNFYAFANRNQHLVGLAASKLELHADALFLADGLVPTPAAQQLRGEIAHIHRLKDFSLHLTLAPADCMIPLYPFIFTVGYLSHEDEGRLCMFCLEMNENRN